MFKLWRYLFIAFVIIILLVVGIYLYLNFSLDQFADTSTPTAAPTLNLSLLNKTLNLITARAADFKRLLSQPDHFTDPAK